MGFFDPPHQKILAKSPAYFRTEIAQGGEVLDQALKRVPATGRDLFRTVVIGSLALRSASNDVAGWSNENTRYAETAVNNAYRFLPNEVRQLALQTVAEIVARPWDHD